MSIPYSECAASMKGWTGGKKKKETQGYPGEQDDAQFKERGSGLGAKKKKKNKAKVLRHACSSCLEACSLARS